MSSYFKRYYLDDVKLAQRALLEFDRALKSGRMIAFTGSMTTEASGYGTWGQLIDCYAEAGGRLVKWLLDPARTLVEWAAAVDLDGILNPAPLSSEKPDTTMPIGRLNAYRRDNAGGGRIDPRVVLGVIEEAVLAATESAQRPIEFGAIPGETSETDRIHEPIDVLSTMIAHYFRRPRHRDRFQQGRESLAGVLGFEPGRIELDVAQELIHALGIRRFATLNYDMELEARLMLPESRWETPHRHIQKLRNRFDGLYWDDESSRIRRVLANGTAIESDILNRDRIDRMLEFAIGADDVDHHILHLHGRACRPDSMILSYRDYDRLYRTNDLMKLPFEFAQRIMIGGNPILFVGLGMSEAEINEALQDFVSASPYQRMAPTFLLWNMNADFKDLQNPDHAVWKDMEMRRLDLFHRLGVLTIFDADVAMIAGGDAARGLVSLHDPARAVALQKAESGNPEKGTAIRAAGVANLCWLVRTLPDAANRIAVRERLVDNCDWRHLSAKFAQQAPGNEPIQLWPVTGDLVAATAEDTARIAEIRSALDVAPPARHARDVIGVVGAAGCGHGVQSRGLAFGAVADGTPANRVLLVNACFSFDTDSMLDGIARFLDFHRGGYAAADGSPKCSRSAYFRALARGQGGRDPRLLIVVNGMERLYGLSGELLSSEVDELLDLACRGLPGVRFVFFGTRRMKADFAGRRIRVIDGEDNGQPPTADPARLPVRRYQAIHDAYARLKRSGEPDRWVADADPAAARALEEARQRHMAHATARTRGEGVHLRKAFYDLYLGRAFEEAFERAGDGKAGELARLGREILRVLAFIGTPTDVCVLKHVPRIRDLPGLARDGVLDETPIHATLVILGKMGLVLSIRGFPALETESADPERPAFQRAALPRTLLTELRYRFSVPLSEAKLSTSFNMSLYVAQPVDGYIPEPDIHDELGDLIDRMLGAYRDKPPPAPDELLEDLNRIAAEVSPHECDASNRRRRRKGVCVKTKLADEMLALAGNGHVQCLRAALALMRGYYTTTDLLTLDVGDRLIREDRDGILMEHAERLDCLIDAYGKTMMVRERLGTKPPAAMSRLAPFYADEIVWLYNECGVVRLAMGDLVAAAAAFERAFEINRRHVERDDRSHNWRRIQINQLTVDVERGELGAALQNADGLIALSGKEEGPPGDAGLREDRLAQAIALGYRGRIAWLQGDRAAAARDLDKALALLGRLREYRCQAYFLRVRSQLGGEQAAADRAAALELATATRQMDIVYRLRVMQASATLKHAVGEDRAKAQRTLDDAIRYALQTDMHRVRAEAGAAQAEIRLASGDFEGALRHVADALMVATRFNMELRKIWLRSLAARIMAARGHPVTGQKLAMSAIRIASRRRYDEAISHAEDTLLDLPRVSKISDVIDVSLRRQL